MAATRPRFFVCLTAFTLASFLAKPSAVQADDPPIPHNCTCNIVSDPTPGITSICVGQSLTLKTVVANISPTAYSWSVVSGGGLVSYGSTTDPTFTVTAVGVVTGDVVIECTITGTGGCTSCVPGYNTAFGGTGLRVNANPVASAGGPFSVCEDSPPFPVGGSPTASGGSGSGYTYLWSGSGLPYLDDDDVANPNFDPTTPGNYQVCVTVTDSNGCFSSQSCATVDVQSKPIATAGSNQTICQTDTVSLSGSCTNGNGTSSWATSGDGNFDNAANINAVYTPGPNDISAGTVTLTLACNAVSPCTVAATDDLIVTIVSSVVADAGGNQSICAGQVATLSGSCTDGNGTSLWTTTGTGSFGDDTDPTTTYTPSPADVLAGSVTLTLECFGNSPCTNDTDSLVLTIKPLPDVNITHNAGGALCPNWAGYVAWVPSISCGMGPPATYAWSISAGGTPVSATNLSTFSFKVGSPPPASVTLTVTVTGCNGCSATNHVDFDVCELPVCQTATLRLEGPANPGCFKMNDYYEVDLYMDNVTCPTAGFQAFLKYREDRLEYIAECDPNPITSSYYTNSPFDLQTIPICVTVPSLNHPAPGKIDLANGINVFAGDIPVSGSWHLAHLKFRVKSNDGCEAVYVDFRPDPHTIGGEPERPPTQLTDLAGFGFGTITQPGYSIGGLLIDSPDPIKIDGTAPVASKSAEIAACYPTQAAAMLAAELNSSATDNCVGPLVQTVAPTPDVDCALTIHVFYTDDCGNVSNFLQYVTRVDDTPPDITCPTDTTIECSASTLPANTGEATATDNCTGTINIAYSDAVTTPPPGCADYDITRTWTATDFCGNASSCVQIIQVRDTTAPVITCPPDAIIECDEWNFTDGGAFAVGTPGIPFGVASGGVAIYYSAAPEIPANQAYLKTQYSYGNANGAQWNFSNAPLTGLGPLVTWSTIFSGIAPPQQFGFDMVLPAPTYAGAPVDPWLLAYDNTNSSIAGRVESNPGHRVLWKIGDYKDGGGGPGNATNVDINSIIRGNHAPGFPVLTDIDVFQQDVTLSGTVYTAVIRGRLLADGLIHWFGPATPHSPMANFNLNGRFYYSGTLTYDSLGDTGTDLIDFYAGDITVVANSPNVGLGFATATDNCTVFPVVTYSDGPLVPNVGCTYTGTVTRTWKAVDACGNESECDQIITIVDNTAPVITCAADVVVNPTLAELEDCDADGVNIVAPTASDNCDATVTVEGVRSDTMAIVTPGPNSFPPGVTTITWTATDDCGNASQCVQTVTVNAVAISVTVELSPIVTLTDPDGVGPLLPQLQRCITFEVFDCVNASQTIEKVMTFNSVLGSAIATGTICAPLGDVTCVTARDRLHTLRSRVDTVNGALTGSAPNYTADFTGKRAGEPGPAGTGHRLVGGNLNDDEYIDILDFGTWAGQYLVNFGTGNTTCATVGPHSDISGDGDVDSDDFSFIAINFLMFREANCCGLLNIVAPPGGQDGQGLVPMVGDAGQMSPGPITSISVQELRARNLDSLIAGDINRDGWLDVNDIILAYMGLPPASPPAGNDGVLTPIERKGAANAGDVWTPTSGSTQPQQKRP